MKVMQALRFGRKISPNFLTPMTSSPYYNFYQGKEIRYNQRSPYIITNQHVKRRSSSAPNVPESCDCVLPPPPPEPPQQERRPDLEKLTHTGQIWAKDDYRNVRFMNAKRYVNENFPMLLGHSQPAFKHKGRIVSCDGGVGILGHPKVFYNLDKPGFMHCFYCGRTFIKDRFDQSTHKQHDTTRGS